ncbi:hypothetical protein [Bradyrhizobium sp. Leo170]|uniref:hypothetical protein n=1 Tax=Bradyrhizobium sp. Leo170 TaxID=1571199 RepID=UPI00102E9E12|nr:hypothetical protein [Bradyrhizobium sp. Leo170]
MGKASPEDVARMDRASRESIASVDEMMRERREDRFGGASLNDDPPVRCSERIESRNQRDRRELQERDERWARERRGAHREERDIEARLMAAVDAKIAAVRAELRADIVEIGQAAGAAVEAIGTAIDDLRDAAKGHGIAAQVEQVEVMFSRMMKRLDEALPRRGDVADSSNQPDNISLNGTMPRRVN